MNEESSPFIYRKLPKFIKFFKGCKNVLEVGSGYGEFLHLCRKAKINAIGLEPDKYRADIIARLGLNVIPWTGKKFLKTTRAKFDGIFASNVIEHMEIKEAREFLALAFKRMTRDGGIAISTVDPSCLGTMETFWNDPEHSRPYSRTMLCEILEEAGFNILRVESDEDTRPHAWWRTLVRKIRTMLVGPYFGPSEFYVMAVKP